MASGARDILTLFATLPRNMLQYGTFSRPYDVWALTTVGVETVNDVTFASRTAESLNHLHLHDRWSDVFLVDQILLIVSH